MRKVKLCVANGVVVVVAPCRQNTRRIYSVNQIHVARWAVVLVRLHASEVLLPFFARAVMSPLLSRGPPQTGGDDDDSDGFNIPYFTFKYAERQNAPRTR